MKKFATIYMLVTFIAMSLAVSVSFAGPQVKEIDTAPISGGLNVPPVRVRPKTDLKVDGIWGGGCKCDLRDVGAIYMGKIKVSVSNNYQQSGGVATGGILKVTYYDLTAGQLKTVTKTIPTLKPYPTNPWARGIIVVNSPILAKRSVGIKAEFQPSAPVIDSNPANNIMTVYKCNVLVN